MAFYNKESETAMRQFWTWTGDLDIGCVQEYLIPRVKHQGWRPSLIVLPSHILCLLDCGLGLFNCCFHSSHELIYCIQSKRSLSGFKAYMGGASGIKQEWSLLGGGMHMVIMLEFYHRQQVVPVVLFFVDKEL